MRFVKLALLGGAAALALGWGVAQTTPYWFAPKENRQIDVSNPQLIARGEYLARAGDCVACHTAPGGAEYAGGLGLQTPMGTIYATNITPDKATGIGNYDYGDFERAVRKESTFTLQCRLRLIASFLMKTHRRFMLFSWQA